jgi:pyruvate dehydrogenase E2 component (dihydrolipoamide acetyltransferase)
VAEKVIMPKLEMAQETGKIIEWLKREGEIVEKDEPLFVIETDKVTVEIESPGSGILAGIRADVGEEVPISTVIAYLLEPGEDLPEEMEDDVKAVAEAPTSVPKEVSSPQPAMVSPVAQRLAEAREVDLGKISGTGPKGRITIADVEKAVEASAVGQAVGRIRATPAARRLAKERGINLSMVQGSGPRGRIHADDILESKPGAVVSMPSAGERIPLDGMRKTIAERMTVSYQTAPHINFTVRVDMSGIEQERKRVNDEVQAQGLTRVSITAFTVMAVAWALKRHLYINSTLVEEEIHLLSDINVGVAVALDIGLIVPVVHNADELGLLEISNRVNDIVARAHEGKLTPADVVSGTFTISNLGPFGIEQFTAIINPPQTAILAVGAIQQDVIPDQNGQISVKPLMRMTLSADHRVIDGAIAARFLMDLKDAMEKPGLFQL